MCKKADNACYGRTKRIRVYDNTGDEHPYL